MTNWPQYLAVCLTALAVTYGLTPWVRRLAIRFGAVDQPDPRRPHKRPTARGGGFAVVAGVQAACVVSLGLPWTTAAGLEFGWWKHFMLASGLLLGVGIVDDLRGLKPVIKLGGQTVAALLMCGSGLRFGSLFGYALPPGLDAILVVFWILSVINAFNLIDGLDGLASSLAIISAVGLAGVLILGRMPGELIVLVALVGASLGFLRYNFHPASIFLGDSGSMFLGFTLGVVSLRTLTKDTFFLSFCIPLLVLGVPIFDEVLAIWRRSVRLWLAKSQPPGGPRRMGIMQPDIDHLHHRLLKAGLSTRRVAGALCALNAALVSCGLLLTMFRSHAAGIFLFALLAAVYVLMRQLAVIELRDTGRVILSGLRRPTHATLKALAFPAWDMASMAGAFALAMWILGNAGPDFWRNWFLDLPVWVTPTFSLLAVSRAYLTVWTRTRPLDTIMLVLTLWAGLLLSLGLALLIDPDKLQNALLTALLTGAISHPGILFVRVFYRLTEECVLYLRSQSETNPLLGEVALYGAGGRCQLYLKERGSHHSSSFDGRLLRGIIDDEPALHGQWVCGLQVLGGLQQLPGILARHRINELVVTTKLRPENARTLQQIASEHGLKLSEWTFGLVEWIGEAEALDHWQARPKPPLDLLLPSPTEH